MFPLERKPDRLQKDRCYGDSGCRTIAAMDNATPSAAVGLLMAMTSLG